MQATLYVPVSRLRQFQDLVKQHNLRFKGNPIIIREQAMITIDGEHLPPGGCNAFWSDWNRLTTPIHEAATPVWKRVMRRIGLKL